MNYRRNPIRQAAATVALVFLVILCASGQTERDPNRPACRDAICRRVQAFVQSKYCGTSPAGDGPDENCNPQYPANPAAGTITRANYHCDWDEQKGVSRCRQIGEPSDSTRKVLLAELHRLGLPNDAPGEIGYDVIASEADGRLVAQAEYSRVEGTTLEICEVIAAVDRNGRFVVLRELRFQKTDADVPRVTTWQLMDFADAEGHGSRDVVLEGDAYEDHWIEVVSLRNGAAKTVFSGLGYYL